MTIILVLQAIGLAIIVSIAPFIAPAVFAALGPVALLQTLGLAAIYGGFIG